VELQSRVREALNRLRLEDREVLVLRYALDWSSNRMSTALNISSAAIDMRLSRARRRLAEILGNTGVGHESD
jgi:RNA polymerase sigma-70 factor (ECF subfamily)